MRNLYRASLLVAVVLLLTTGTGWAQLRPQCLDDQGNPQFEQPGACFIDAGPITISLFGDFDGDLNTVILHGSPSDFTRTDDQGTVFWHANDPEAQFFTCLFSAQPGCLGRLMDPTYPRYFPGELIGTGRANINMTLLPEGAGCPLVVSGGGEVRNEAGDSFQLTNIGLFTPAPNDECKIQFVDIRIGPPRPGNPNR